MLLKPSCAINRLTFWSYTCTSALFSMAMALIVHVPLVSMTLDLFQTAIGGGMAAEARFGGGWFRTTPGSYYHRASELQASSKLWLCTSL